MLDQTFDRLQKLMSQLELMEEKLSQEYVNQKLLRSLSLELNTHVVVWRNKVDLDSKRIDEFVNKLVVKNCKVKSSKEEPKVVRKNDDTLIIKEYVSDNEEEDVSQPKIEKKTVTPSIAKIEFVKSKQQEKTARKTIK
nr:hypothetical protein [Tanacetum cinerariifolium]